MRLVAAVAELGSLGAFAMSRCYQTVCRTEEEACAAFHATYNIFDHIETTAYGRKRYAESLLWRFDDELPIVERMVTALRDSGLFTDVREISAEFFWSTRSYGV